MRKLIPLLLLAPLPVRAAPVTVHVAVDRTAIPEGRSVIVTAEVTKDGKPTAGITLHPYVNGKRWGVEAVTNARGRAEWPLPLPNPGAARIEVAVSPPDFRSDAKWIWADTTRGDQTLYFQKSFRLPAAPSAAKLYITADDSFEAWLNGHRVAGGADLNRVYPVVALERWLKVGENVLTVRATNAIGPGGLLAKVVAQTLEGRVEVPTDATWRVAETRPAGWPAAMAGGGASEVMAALGTGPWRNVTGWPGYTAPERYPVGKPLPAGAARSNAVTVRVTKRTFPKARPHPDRLVGMEWEPWFTPKNIPWDTAEAIPLIGRYDSFNKDVIRQHALWFIEAGVDFLVVDWTNNLWDKKRFADREPAADEILAATTAMVDTYAAMRAEGIPVPRVTLLPGLNNGPSTTTTAMNEQMRWAYDHYIKNPRYAGLWQQHEGKPLMVVFNGGGPDVLRGQPPVETSDFTERWMASQLQGNHLEKAGYWSWMDGLLHPIPTYHDGGAEALTITPAFFGEGGWTYPQAVARRGGATFAEQFRYAMGVRPKFLILNQWNEFAGQPKGGGYGPKHDQYVDCYTVPLSNDIEPTSTTLRGYRGDLGYGFFYQNLTRALVRLYHGEHPGDTLLTVARPERGASVEGGTLAVEWHAVGRSAASYSVELDGRTMAANVRGLKANVPLKDLKPGAHRLTVRANGARTHFPLSTTREDLPLARPVPTVVNVVFTLER